MQRSATQYDAAITLEVRVRKRKKKLREARFDASKMFERALDYFYAADAVGKAGYPRPYYVLQVFALEIALKCLHRVRGHPSPRGHNPGELYDSLKPRDRRRIKKHFVKH